MPAAARDFSAGNGDKRAEAGTIAKTSRAEGNPAGCEVMALPLLIFRIMKYAQSNAMAGPVHKT